MLQKIIEASVRNRFLVLLVTAALAGWGAYALVQTPVGRLCLGYAITTWIIGVVSLTRMARVDY